ncbi:hypothetical protein B0H13DRAFT_1885355 [Mycena leptocephala]|nr:hypothetical protein B0H13DRAFT_1885355 [Mycena leptocephala]
MSSAGGPDIVGASRAASSPSTSTFHIRQTVSRRPLVDTRLLQRFILAYIDKNDVDPAVLSIDSCPTWPSYVLDSGVLAKLGDDIAELDWFSPALGMWIGIGARYVHTVSTNCVVLLKRHGVRGCNEDMAIGRFFPQSQPAHLRYNLSGERAAVRKQYKSTTATPILVESDSDVEVVSEPEVQAVSRKRLIKIEQGASPPRQRPKLSINTSLGPPSSSASTVSPPSTTFTLTPSETPSTSATTPSSSSPPPSPSSYPAWPRGLYVADLGPGFARMKDMELKSMPAAARFQHVFGSQYEYHKGTYQQNAAYWWRATPTLRTEGMKAGRTLARLWSEFRERVKECT